MQPRLQLADNLVFRNEDQICFNKTTGCVFSLNQTGYAALLHFGQATTVEHVVQSLALLWKIEPDTVLKDLEPLVAELIDRQFLTEVGDKKI